MIAIYRYCTVIGVMMLILSYKVNANTVIDVKKLNSEMAVYEA